MDEAIVSAARRCLIVEAAALPRTMLERAQRTDAANLCTPRVLRWL
jgi:hypothetical protein